MLRISFFSLLLAATAAIVFSSCDGGSKDTELLTKNNFRVVLHETQDGERPKVGDRVFFLVKMYTEDTTYFDSWELNDTIERRFPDLTEALQRGPAPFIEAMHVLAVGDSATLYVPASTDIDPPLENFDNPELTIYTLRILRIKPEAEHLAEQEVLAAKAEERMNEVTETMTTILEEYKNNSLGDRLQQLEGGLSYVVIESGDGAAPAPANQVGVDYVGMLMNGEIFDSSIPRLQQFQFQLGARQVIPGWDMAVAQMKEGDKWMVFLPAALAYGEMGTPGGPIGPNSDLAFMIELQDAGN